MDKLIRNDKEITIESACDIDSELLIDYYREVYPDRIDLLEKNWRWLNRVEYFDYKLPLVMFCENKVIAHSGLIPFTIDVNDKRCPASWYRDFTVQEEFQRQGLGSILTQEWLKFSDVNMAFCNPKSLALFKKAGWGESKKTYKHLNFIAPFNHLRFATRLPNFLRKLLNLVLSPVFYLIYSIHSYSNEAFELEKMTESSFTSFYESYKEAREANVNTISPHRDQQFVDWRIMKSPNKENYHIFKTEKFSALVSLTKTHTHYIDILWVSDINDKTKISKMISTLGMYGLKNGYSYIRFYTSKEDLSAHIKKKTFSIVRHPGFAYFSNEEAMFSQLEKANWDFELIDSDFEDIG